MTTPAVAFSYTDWIARFPEFGEVTPQAGQNYFDLADSFFANSVLNPAFCASNFSTMLYLLTSHIAWLLSPRDGQGRPSSSGTQPPPGVVGRISSASEGSVSVASVWNGSGSPTEDWYLQTQYGAMFWVAAAPYRTARYIARPTVVVNGVYPAYPNRFRW